jgi:UDP-N-acetylmuramate dehydrogenase
MRAEGPEYYSNMPSLRDFLEKINIRAEVAYDEPMAAHTSFRIGGPADALVRPLDEDSAIALVRAAAGEGMPLFFLGGGANLLVGDKGIRGIVLDSAALRSLRYESARAAPDAGSAYPGAFSILRAGAGLPVDELCLEALCLGLGGIEDFAGMPGAVGGAVFMNARCYEREMSRVLARVRYLAADGHVGERGVESGEWDYKKSPFQPGGPCAGSLVLEASFRLAPADPSRLAATMRARRADREAKGHYRLPSAGSVFKNDRRFGKPTGKILDELGFRGRSVGGAMISNWHANIFVNAGGASAADMRKLIELAQREVRERLGYELEPEVLMVGEF